MNKFRAFRIHADTNGTRAGIEQLSLDDLTSGDVIIEAEYSGVNYKDALAATGTGKILRRSPLVGGIDVAGTVIESGYPQFHPGDPVLISGSGLSEIYDGGYAEYVRVPANCVIPLPAGLTLFESMVLGTPALTSALALHRMEQLGQEPGKGPILITGASGGVGNLAVSIFASRGYHVTAVTGKPELKDQLIALGATEVINRHDLKMGTRPLEKALWGGAVDTVGGETLAWLTRTVNEWGNIASIGLAGGSELNTTVMPFILRGVSILGINSTTCSSTLRRQLWQQLGSELKPKRLDLIHQGTITMEQLMPAFQKILAGKLHGRTIVKIRN
ncbi:MAG: YhdH/YhfP family quinone oxidoreductase [Gammaproteobacteria bacterium]|nr:YhdH/YhfP family quinone oxidoreductase [Gammaproteobacteria bacterium]